MAFDCDVWTALEFVCRIYFKRQGDSAVSD